MSFWMTTTGQRTIATLREKYCRQNSRQLLVIGPYGHQVLMAYLSEAVRMRTMVAASIGDLYNLSIPAGDCLILLKSLTGSSADPVKDLQRFCRNNNLNLLWSPQEVTAVDFAQAYQYEISSTRWQSLGAGWDWIVEIAHETALIVSGGVYSCYFGLRNQLLECCKANPEGLPDVEQCVRDFAARMDARTRADRETVLADRTMDEETRWLILWSTGSAGRYNGVWQLSCDMLDRPGYYRVLQFRIEQAYSRTIPPIYNAWVLYCEQKYHLRELDDDRKLHIWYPGSVSDYLNKRPQADANPDTTQAWAVRGIRNWLQHRDNEQGWNQSQDSVFAGCAAVIRLLDRQGRKRQ